MLPRQRPLACEDVCSCGKILRAPKGPLMPDMRPDDILTHYLGENAAGAVHAVEPRACQVSLLDRGLTELAAAAGVHKPLTARPAACRLPVLVPPPWP